MARLSRFYILRHPSALRSPVGGARTAAGAATAAAPPVELDGTPAAALTARARKAPRKARDQAGRSNWAGRLSTPDTARDRPNAAADWCSNPDFAAVVNVDCDRANFRQGVFIAAELLPGVVRKAVVISRVLKRRKHHCIVSFPGRGRLSRLESLQRRLRRKPAPPTDARAIRPYMRLDPSRYPACPPAPR